MDAAALDAPQLAGQPGCQGAGLQVRPALQQVARPAGGAGLLPQRPQLHCLTWVLSHGHAARTTC